MKEEIELLRKKLEIQEQLIQHLMKRLEMFEENMVKE